MIRKTLILSFLLSTPAFAWLCPNNFNTINPGQTLQEIKTACGAPVSEKKTTLDADVPQEWGYYVPVNPPNPATIKMNVVIVNKKVVNITINAMSLVSSSVCGGTINVGDSADSVKATCGNPMFINKGPADPKQKKTEVNELLYNGPPPNQLIFENGILKERK